MKFLKTVSLVEAVDLLAKATSLPGENELVSIREAAGRYLAADLLAPDDIPYYDRSTVDGYAVVSRATQGASDAVPVVLRLKGSLAIGTLTDERITADETFYVPTGGMVPPGADAMVMIEDAAVLDDLILIQRPAAVGANLVRQGEDVRRGSRVLSEGHRLRSQDIGVLAQLNLLSVPVRTRPRVFIISTGDEFALPGEDLGSGKIRDVNTYTIAALAEEIGLTVTGTVLVRDDLALIQAAIARGIAEADLVLLSGGSSAGERDYTKTAIEALGGEILFHGIRIKPGKPTIGAALAGKPVIGLPGHPVSAMMLFKTLVTDYFQRVTATRVPQHRIMARTAVNFPSAPGKLTCQFLRLTETPTGPRCHPFYSNSALVSQLTGANGFTLIPEETEGLDQDTYVEVILL